MPKPSEECVYRLRKTGSMHCTEPASEMLMVVMSIDLRTYLSNTRSPRKLRQTTKVRAGCSLWIHIGADCHYRLVSGRLWLINLR